MKCCICKGEIEVKGNWTEGNNAQPIKDGRCCDVCDETKVTLARLTNKTKQRGKMIPVGNNDIQILETQDGRIWMKSNILGWGRWVYNTELYALIRQTQDKRGNGK